VHKALYAAQREELGLFLELFREDPSPLWRGNKRPAMGPNDQIRRQRLQQALDNYDLVPASDPNVPSHMHRLAKANAYLQTAMALPGVFILQNVIKRWAAMVKIDGVEADLAPPQQGPQPDPVMMAKIALENRKVDVLEGKAQTEAQKAHAQLSGQLPDGRPTLDAQQLALQAHQGQAQLQSKEQIEAVKVAHQAHQSMQPPEQVQPDPLQHRALDLKQQQIDQKGTEIAFDQHHRQKELDSKEAIEAFKFATTAGVHPEAAGVMDQQMAKVAPFLQPAAQQRSMSDGGPVDSPIDADTRHRIWLAAEIAKALQESQDQRYTN
jgi:hypothetical protein